MALYLLLVFLWTISQDFTSAFSGDVSYNCGDGEEYLMCGSPCERKCSTRYSQTYTCSEQCRPGCYCREGLVRSSDGYCILPQHCERPLCSENEVYSECGSSCPANCTNYQEIFCTERCRRGCSCKPGYVRGPDGRCIDPYDCPITSCGPNEEISDCVNPCNDCNLRGRCYFQDCKKGCDCIPGYHRNDAGQCVPLGLCTRIAKSCPANEQYVQCVNTCNDCWSYGQCSQTYCTPGCDCKPRFFRNQNNDCIPEYQCPTSNPICKENEEYVPCANPCNDCENKGRCKFSCTPGCDCKKDFHRDEYGECIPGEFCGTGDLCKQYEEYLLCGTACPQTCDNYRQQIVCTQQCHRGCFCTAGYVRAINGTCVLPRDCPAIPIQRCPVNEVYYVCKPQCRNTCETFNSTNGVCPNTCESGCFCQNGFVKRRDGLCVRPSECPLTNRSICNFREVPYECIPNCRTSCDTLNETDAFCTIECRAGCFCPYNEVRNASGSCISIRDCPRGLSSNVSSGSIEFRRKSFDENNATTSPTNINTTLTTEKQPTNITSSTQVPNTTFETTGSKQVSSAISPVTSSAVPKAVTENAVNQTSTNLELKTLPSISSTRLLTTRMDAKTTAKEGSNSSMNTKNDGISSSTENIPCHNSTNSLSSITGKLSENITTGTDGKNSSESSTSVKDITTGIAQNFTTS